VEVVRRWNARRRSPSIRALREAGPPTRWTIAAIPAALVLVIALYLAGIDNRLVLLATPFAVFVAVCFLDRTGWMVRMAIAELGVRQRERWRWGSLPIDSLGAAAWLQRHADAPPIARAPVLATAERHDEARALVASATAELPQDAVNLARLRILFDAEARDDHSVAGAVASLDATPELAAVPAEERRAQRLSVAWSIAWLRVSAHEPWRDELADAIRDLGPFRVAWRYKLFHAWQHYALPIAYVGALLIVWGLGLLDVLTRS
jgi:hypothetical protein